MSSKRVSKKEALALPAGDFDAAVSVPEMPAEMVEAPIVKGDPCDINKARGILTALKAKSAEYWKARGEAPPAGAAARMDVDLQLTKIYGRAK